VNSKPTLGTDLEFFVFSENKIISADRIFPHSDNREWVGAFGSVYFDSIAGEINPRPNISRIGLVHNIQRCLNHAYLTASKKYKNINFLPAASVKITPETIEGTHETCRHFFHFHPDTNIYNNKSTFCPDELMTRFAGGHIHIGFKGMEYQPIMEDKKENLIQILDAVLGIMSVAMSFGWEEQQRRKYYGAAGNYRDQIHGIEYRTLSTFWMTSPELVLTIMGIARDCLTICLHNKDVEFLQMFDQKEVVDTINNTKVEKAKEIYTEIIKPYYLKSSLTNSPMIHERTRSRIDLMIENGYQFFYSPYNLLECWFIQKHF